MKKTYKNIFILFVLVSLVTSLELISTDEKLDNEWHISYERNRVYNVPYKVQDTECLIINSETSGTDKPSVMITEVYFDGKQVVQNMVVKPNDNGNNRKNFVGLKLKFQVVKSQYEGDYQNLTKYLCFQSKNDLITCPKCKFHLSVYGFQPNDDVHVLVDMVPPTYEIENCTKKKMIYMGFDNKRCLLKVGNCSYSNITLYDQCQLKNKVSLSFLDGKTQYITDDKILLSVKIPQSLQKSSLKITLFDRKNSNRIIGNLQTLYKKDYEIKELTIDLKEHELIVGQHLSIGVDENVVLNLEIVDYSTMYTNFALVFLAFSVVFSVFIVYNHFFKNSKPNATECKDVTILSQHNTEVYVGFSDRRKCFETQVVGFTRYLGEKLGIKVNVAVWDPTSESSGSAWMEKIFETCNKFIFIWSKEAVMAFDNEEKFKSNPDIFCSMAFQLKQGLLRNTISKDKVISVYFEEECNKLIPVWFKKQVDKHLDFINQFQEMYNLLHNYKVLSKYSEPRDDKLEDESKVSLLIKPPVIDDDLEENFLHVESPLSEGNCLTVDVVPPDFNDYFNFDFSE